MADFVFADDYRLGQSPTRRFYEFFLKGYIHKHNNLMGVIQGFSSLILFDDTINSEVRESAEQMQTSAKAATDLNRDILGATGCARCEPAPMQLSDVLPFWKSKAEEIGAASRVGVELNVREPLPPVMADSTRLGETFFHLVRNAVEASTSVPGSSIAIDLFPPGEASQGGTVDLFIRNRCEPLDEETLRRYFLPFETSKGSEHFGIGLTAASILAGDMGTRLGLRSSEGTMTAWLAIPVAG
ncbi:MAG: HAMP domain-containing histidine kinase [Verrucomicrobiae bacterium]|nr:HAMP domain-containing histidine kinase [Verrucomicrobiae bacterium]